VITDQYKDGAWWQYKWYSVIISAPWSTERQEWLAQNCGKYRTSLIVGDDILWINFMFREEADAVAFKIKYGSA
jgi:hypothetical protein